MGPSMEELRSAVRAELVGLNLRDADMALDEARRKLFAKRLMGGNITGGARDIEAHARYIADRIRELELHQVMEVIEGVRAEMWRDAFPETAEAAFRIPGRPEFGGDEH